MSARLFYSSYLFLITTTLIIVLIGSAIFPITKLKERDYVRNLLESEQFKDCTIKDINGTFTAYCPGPCCNTAYKKTHKGLKKIDWSDRVAVGGGLSLSMLLHKGINVAAVDHEVIPHGSVILWNGKYYLSLDSGRNIKGTKVDICLPVHDQTNDFGIKKGQRYRVYIPEKPLEVVDLIQKKFKRTQPQP